MLSARAWLAQHLASAWMCPEALQVARSSQPLCRTRLKRPRLANENGDCHPGTSPVELTFHLRKFDEDGIGTMFHQPLKQIKQALS
eukprot:7889267-Pyramimonas_sp.AAC.1